jgi:hypothetical protein
MLHTHVVPAFLMPSAPATFITAMDMQRLPSSMAELEALQPEQRSAALIALAKQYECDHKEMHHALEEREHDIRLVDWEIKQLQKSIVESRGRRKARTLIEQSSRDWEDLKLSQLHEQRAELVQRRQVVEQRQTALLRPATHSLNRVTAIALARLQRDRHTERLQFRHRLDYERQYRQYDYMTEHWEDFNFVQDTLDPDTRHADYERSNFPIPPSAIIRSAAEQARQEAQLRAGRSFLDRAFSSAAFNEQQLDHASMQRTAERASAILAAEEEADNRARALSHQAHMSALAAARAAEQARIQRFILSISDAAADADAARVRLATQEAARRGLSSQASLGAHGDSRAAQQPAGRCMVFIAQPDASRSGSSAAPESVQQQQEEAHTAARISSEQLLLSSVNNASSTHRQAQAVVNTGSHLPLPPVTPPPEDQEMADSGAGEQLDAALQRPPSPDSPPQTLSSQCTQQYFDFLSARRAMILDITAPPPTTECEHDWRLRMTTGATPFYQLADYHFFGELNDLQTVQQQQ